MSHLLKQMEILPKELEIMHVERITQPTHRVQIDQNHFLLRTIVWMKMRLRQASLSALLAFLVALLSIPAGVLAQKHSFVDCTGLSVSDLDLFAFPATGTDVQAQLKCGERVIRLEDDNGWTKVRTNAGSVGWIRKWSLSSRSPKQQSCRFRVEITWRDWDDPTVGERNKLSDHQEKWWFENGRKEFPDLCIVANSAPPDYVILWYELWEKTEQEITVSRREVTEHSGTVNLDTWNYGKNSGHSRTSGIYRGRSTTTRQEKEKVEYYTWTVHATLHKAEEGPEGTQIRSSIYTAKRAGSWLWSKPDKDAMIEVMKFLSKAAR